MTAVYGLTGGIASGKSTVAAILKRRGAEVIDADLLARQAVAPGSVGLERIREAFGERFVLPDGTLDREALGAHVFGDEAARQRLNAILHPLIAAASAQRIAEAMAGPRAPIFYDAALLVETGRARDFAALIVVACDEDTQRQRLMDRDGLTAEQATARIRSQLPLSEKVAVADHVLQNDGAVDALEHRVDALLDTLRQTP